MRRIRRRYKVLLGIAGFVALAIYFPFVHRFHSHVENAGWVVNFSHIVLGCPFCRGRVEHFTYNGQPVPVPQLPDGTYPMITLIAPVGHFEARSGWTEYRSHGVGQRNFGHGGEPLTPEELVQGFYEVSATGSWPPQRRPGTPDHWCLALCGDIERWLDPKLLDDLVWLVPSSQPTSNAVP